MTTKTDITMPSDEELLALLQTCGALTTAAGVRAIRAALSRYSSGQPAAGAEPVDVRNAHAIADLVNSADQATGPIEALHEAIDRLAAPVAQEPVAWMTADGRVAPDETKRKSMPAPSREAFCIPLYAAPVAAQAQPTMPPLTEAMRAVLRNEHCVYDSEDALYTALCDAAQAQLSGISGELGAQDREDAGDPLQGAANWLFEAVVDCGPDDLQRRLLIGHNRAGRLLDAARAAKGEA